jgi:hypothetical protein
MRGRKSFCPSKQLLSLDKALVWGLLLAPSERFFRCAGIARAARSDSNVAFSSWS